MADFEIIEADFQQYYDLDISNLKFQRYARLLLNLPIEARFMKKHIPSKDWDFDRETQSRILMTLDIISCQLSNIFKKKGAKPRKPAEQFQPDYVRETKKETERRKKQLNENVQKDLIEIFEKRNNEVKKFEEKING